MATSNSTNFSVSRDDIINSAYRKAGVIDAEVGTCNAAQLSVGAHALNVIVKAFHEDGMPLWAIKKGTITLSATNAYTITTVAVNRPIRIIKAFNHNISTLSDVEMYIATRDEYWRLGNKSTTGNPNMLYYDPQLTSDLATIFLYPTPDTASIALNNVQFFYQRPFEDFDAAGDTPDFPQEWYSAIIWELAFTVGMENLVGERRLGMIQQKASIERQLVLGMGTEEGSTFLSPDFTRNGR